MVTMGSSRKSTHFRHWTSRRRDFCSTTLAHEQLVYYVLIYRHVAAEVCSCAELAANTSAAVTNCVTRCVMVGMLAHVHDETCIKAMSMWMRCYTINS